MQPAGFVLALGGANLDINAGAGGALRPGDSTPGRIGFSPGGVARNVAENLARLGHPTRLLSAVGDDVQGHGLLAQTRQAGVDVSGCWVLPGAATAGYVSVHDVRGYAVAAVNDMQILEHITPARLQPFAQPVREAAALVLDCNLPEAALAWLFVNHGLAPVFVDAVSAAKCTRVRPWLAQVHTLKVNRLEAQALSGLPVGSSAEIEAAARHLLGLGVQRVVLSLGAQGLYYSEHGAASGWLAALPVNVVQASGAGDALMAGLVHAFLAGEPLAQAVRFAGACAALTLTVGSANHPELSVGLVERTMQSAAAR